jgi:CheY-like chemotaxis protein
MDYIIPGNGVGWIQMKTVFIADDDGLLREMLARSLERESYRVRTFGSPTELLSTLDSDPPDIVVSDVQMPEMNGIELIEAIREQWSTLPVIMMSGHVALEVENRARELGVSHVLTKPIKDPRTLASLIGETLERAETDSRPLEGLDQLRLSFLTSLSHELRTPLTAIKIALDGLFADDVAGATPGSRKLIDISQRNLDRIIRLVENQLDLLQVTLGEVAVSRRLASLKAVVGSAVGMSAGEIPRAKRSHRPADGDGLYLFTDPERLRSVIEYFLNSASDAFIEGCVIGDGGREIVIEFINTDIARVSGEDVTFGDVGSSIDLLLDPSTEVSDLEHRACRCLVEALGGRIDIFEGRGVEKTRLHLPVFPQYDGRVDCAFPLEHLRHAAVLNGKRVTVVKCRIHGDRYDAGQLQPAENEFLQRCLSTLSDGDILVRGPHDSEYYLAVLERTDAHVEETIAFLETPVFPQTQRSVVAEAVRSLGIDRPFAEEFAPIGD